MDILQILKDFQGHQWLPLAILVIAYGRRLAQPDTKFPVSVPAQWLPTVTGGLSMATVFVTSLISALPIGMSLLASVVAGVGIGFFDGLLTAIFGDASKAPSWARSIVFLVDDLAGKPAPGAK